MQTNLKKSNFGFTLVELMTVIAIIGILASAIMISLSVQKKRATVNRVLTEMSGIMENIYLCKSDDGTIKNPTETYGKGDVCNISSNYGTWPDVSDDVLGNGAGFSITIQGGLNSGSWAYWASGTGTEVICCNSTSGKCGKLDSGSSCTTSTVIN